MDELLAEGFRLISWDGVTPIALVDRDGRVVVMLAGRPAGDSWVEAVKTATTMLLAMRVEFAKRGENTSHRRGKYAFIGTGVSFGGGQTFPSNLKNASWKQEILDKLVSCKAFRRIAGFGNGEPSV